MKSWVSIFMPKDEYKEKRMLYFFSEGAILLVLFLAIMLISNNFIGLNTGVILFASIVIFNFYVLGRYILSGMEYSDIATEKEYKKAVRALKSRTASFVVLFAVFYLIYEIVSSSPYQASWFQFLGAVISVGIVSFVFDFISLKRSYKKNKELL